MDEILKKYFADDLSKLSGLEIVGTIPVDDKLADEFIREELAYFGDGQSEQKAVEKTPEWYTRFFKWLSLRSKSEEGRVVLQVNLKI